MPTIIIKRTSEYNNRLRDFKLFVDGEKVGTIANGETKEFETSSGEHTIIAKIDWCSSSEISFTLNDSEKKEFTVGGFKNGNWLMPIGIMLIALSYSFQKTLNYKFGNIALIPLFILIVYYLTLGRKKYLSLTDC